MTPPTRWWQTEVRVRALPVALLLVNACVYLALSGGTPICFDDCVGYIGLMGKGSIGEYVQAYQSMFRAWFVPVFFSLFGKYTLATASSVALVQTVVLHLSWLLFAWAIAGLFRGWLARVAFVLVGLSMYAQQYYVLNKYLLSDSLAMSTVLWHLSTVVAFDRICARAGRWWSVALLVLTGLCAAGARDANLSLVVLGGAYVAFVHGGLLARRHLLAATLGLILVVVNQLSWARARHIATIPNIVVGFVLPSEPVRQFFVKRGLPASIAERGASFVSQPWCSADIQRIIEYRVAAAIPERELKKASRIYALWLATHPGYVLEHAYEDVECILGQSFGSSGALGPFKSATQDVLFTYPGDKVITIQQGARRLAPSDFVGVKARLWLALAAAAVLGVSLARGRRGYEAPSLLLVLGGLSNAVASYFADLWQTSEMMRHALVGSVLFNVGFVVSCFSVVALLMDRWRSSVGMKGAPGAAAAASGPTSSGGSELVG